MQNKLAIQSLIPITYISLVPCALIRKLASLTSFPSAVTSLIMNIMYYVGA